MTPELLFVGRPANEACHDLCDKIEAPIGIEHLLGLGAKYCEKRTTLKSKTLDDMMSRLRTNVRWKYIFRHEDETEDDYIPGLHINTDRVPDLASEEIENAMNNFEKRIRKERAKYAPRPIHSNLTPMQRGLATRLINDDVYKVACTDKNCGLAIAETAILTKQGVEEHLSDPKVYKRLTQGEAKGQLRGVKLLVESFTNRS